MQKIKGLEGKNILEAIERESLEEKLASGKKLRIKFGADPTQPDLHLGHIVCLKQLREFQKRGDKIIFLVGDFTAKIGDPSFRNKTRPALSDREIEENTKTYLAQVGKILDVSECEIRRNSEWYGKMSFAEILEIAGKVTLAQVIERQDFKKRLETGKDIGLHEVIYPVMQGYDSVVLDADVEIGGQDQKLNMLMGRDLQRKYAKPEQEVIIMPLLVGTDGKKKMSKSYDNYIGIAESPKEQFGKIMSIQDELIEVYSSLLSLAAESKDEEVKILSDKKNPVKAKDFIAFKVVEMCHSRAEAEKVREQFDRVFRKKELPENIKTIKVSTDNIIDILVEVKFAPSKSEARRLVAQGGVKVAGQTISSEDFKIDLKKSPVLQVGKRHFVKIKN